MKGKVEFGVEAAPASADMDAEGVRRIVEVFEGQVGEGGYHPAAQLVVLRRGKVVVDRAAGKSRGKPITGETPFLIFSASKAFTGICVHKLIEEGKVALEGRVADYWPEFGQRGKEEVRIKHVFLHQACVPVSGIYSQFLLWPSWQRVTRSLARMSAAYSPGSQTAYHLVNYGFILGEVVRRVTGLPIETYLREQFLEPLGLRHTWMRAPDKVMAQSPRIQFAGNVEFQQKATARLFNLGFVRRSVIPAAGMHSTARDIAVFYQMLVNGGEYGGRRYLKAETLEAATSLGYEGYDTVLDEQTRWAYGFHLGGRPPTPGMPGPTMGTKSTIRTFGHFGNRTVLAWADPEAQLVVAFTCNRFLDKYHNRVRWKAISDAVWEAAK